MHYLSIDIITNLLATDYAYHLTSNPHEPTTFQMMSLNKITKCSLTFLLIALINTIISGK